MKKIIVGIGEVLWDMLPAGKQLGGAPMNFAYWAKQLGNEAFMVSAVGNDSLGEEIFAKLKSVSLSDKYIQIKHKIPTGTVDVKLDANGKPEYVIHENVAWDFIEWNDKLNALAVEADAVCFGSLAQRSEVSRGTILRFLENVGEGCVKLFDINLRQKFFTKEIIEKSIANATVLKLNDEELPVVAEMFELTSDDESKIARDLIQKFNLEMVALTRGANGSLLVSKNEISEHFGKKVKIKDTVGAGDSFSAAIICGLLEGKELAEINELANELAARVCGLNGGVE